MTKQLRKKTFNQIWLVGTVLGVCAFSCNEAGRDTDAGADAGADTDPKNPNSSSGGAGGNASATGGETNTPSKTNTCKADMECEGGKICQFGSCREAACTADTDCGPGRICDGGRCGVESCAAPLIPFVYTPADGVEPVAVFLTGSMNAWSSEKLAAWALSKQSDGSWSGEFAISTGQQTYKYQVYSSGSEDPAWLSDENIEAWADDGYAGKNSLIGVSCTGLELVPVECNSDDECAPGRICGTISCVTAQCSMDEHCPQSEICEAGRCEAPAQECDNLVPHTFSLLPEDIPSGVGTGLGGAGAEALSVFVAGDFTSWGDNKVELGWDGAGWSASLDLVGGLHEYKLVVDGEWIQDPANELTRNTNSLIELPCSAGMGGFGGTP